MTEQLRKHDEHTPQTSTEINNFLEKWDSVDVKKLLKGEIPTDTEDLLDLRKYVNFLGLKAVKHLSDRKVKNNFKELGLNVYPDHYPFDKLNPGMVIAAIGESGYPYIGVEHRFSPIASNKSSQAIENQSTDRSWTSIEFENYPVGFGLTTGPRAIYSPDFFRVSPGNRPTTYPINSLPVVKELRETFYKSFDLLKSISGDEWEFAYKMMSYTKEATKEPYIVSNGYEREMEKRVDRMKSNLGIYTVVFQNP